MWAYECGSNTVLVSHGAMDSLLFTLCNWEGSGGCLPSASTLAFKSPQASDILQMRTDITCMELQGK